MKKILLALLLALPLPAFALPAVVQTLNINSTSGASSYNVTLASAPVSGNNELMTYSTSATSSTISSITQTCATWAREAQYSVSGRLVDLWRANVTCTGGTSITVTFSIVATAGWAGTILEVSGLTTTTITNATVTGSTGTNVSPTITPTSGHEAFLIAIGRAGAAPATSNGTPAAGWVGLPDSAATPRGLAAYLIVSSTSGAYSPIWVTTSSGTYNAIIFSYLGPTAAAPTGNQAAVFFHLLSQ